MKNDDRMLVVGRTHRWSVFLVGPLESGSISIAKNSFAQACLREIAVRFQTTLLLVELERVDPMI